MILGPGVNAILVASRATSWNMAAGPTDPRADVRLLMSGDKFLTQWVMGDCCVPKLVLAYC